MSYAIITKVKNLLHNKYALAECRLKLGDGWDRTLLVDWGQHRYNDDDQFMGRFTRGDVVTYENSILIPKETIQAGLQYLLDIYDTNLPYDLKEMKVYSYFIGTRLNRAQRFIQEAERIREKFYGYGG